MRLLFREMHLRKGHVWSGSFETDRYSVSIGMYDLRSAIVRGSFRLWLQTERVDLDSWHPSIWQMFQQMMTYVPSFTSRDA